MQGNSCMWFSKGCQYFWNRPCDFCTSTQSAGACKVASFVFKYCLSSDLSWLALWVGAASKYVQAGALLDRKLLNGEREEKPKVILQLNPDLESTRFTKKDPSWLGNSSSGAQGKECPVLSTRESSFPWLPVQPIASASMKSCASSLLWSSLVHAHGRHG